MEIELTEKSEKILKMYFELIDSEELTGQELEDFINKELDARISEKILSVSFEKLNSVVRRNF
jgi:hypothetical protein